MTKFPRKVSGRACRNAFARLGFIVDHQRGSHIVMRHMDGRHAIIPDHRAIKVGTLLRLIRPAGVTRDEFLAAL